MSDIRKISVSLKNQEWFNPTFAQSLVNMLGEISETDGVSENEKATLRNLAKFWGVEPPYKIESADIEKTEEKVIKESTRETKKIKPKTKPKQTKSKTKSKRKQKNIQSKKQA